MRFCRLLLASALALGCFAEAPKSSSHTTVRGKLRQRAGQPPALETADHKFITFDGEEDALKVLNDKRLNGFELEAQGHFTAPDHFVIDANHARTLVALKDGKVKMISYWCDVCSIRSYAPGPCWCCQSETVLQLRDPGQE